MPIKVICEVCNKAFDVLPSRAKRAIGGKLFCCIACRRAWGARNQQEITCRHCGGKSKWSPSKAKRYKDAMTFCHMKCYRAWEATTKIAVKCSECGKEFIRYSHHASRNGHQFCSGKCHGVWRGRQWEGENHPRWVHGLIVNCEQCGKEVRKGKERQRRNKHNFCSSECSRQWMVENEVYTGENNHNWKGGSVDYYGPNWHEQARLARQRDASKCQHCGKKSIKIGRRVDVHHVIPFRTFGYIRNQNDNYKLANRLDNLICLCPQCHAKAEAQLIPIQPSLLP